MRGPPNLGIQVTVVCTITISSKKLELLPGSYMPERNMQLVDSQNSVVWKKGAKNLKANKSDTNPKPQAKLALMRTKHFLQLQLHVKQLAKC